MAAQNNSRKTELKLEQRRVDTRHFFQKVGDALDTPRGAMFGCALLPAAAVLTLPLPFSGELLLLACMWFHRRAVNVDRRAWDFPVRAPAVANLYDASDEGGGVGEGIFYLGHEKATGERVHVSNDDARTHQLVLGTTGSGKTEYLLGLAANAFTLNTGLIYTDGKGDPKLQQNIFRLARRFGREDDLLIINFITSGRDFLEAQVDKVTNDMNIMGASSSGMLIELIVALMDDSGGSGDMWKGRAISYVASVTRPLIYLRDKGYINLSPEKYLEYFELSVLEELVFEHNGRYGPVFDIIVAPLKTYLLTLPGYQVSKMKKQEQKTLEQHGFIVMQLTRVFNDLTFNYGHIFRTRVGDVDFFDVVLNRRILTVLLPALERAPDSLKMLGKLIVGSIKQMMAGCLGNKVEGVVREIIDSRPTNAPVPFLVILDEYGYYAVIGFAVAPAQARSLGFYMTFAAQDFSSLKKSSPEEADATWENTNVRVVGRLTSGDQSETWQRMSGAAGEAIVAVQNGFERSVGAMSDSFRRQDGVSLESAKRLNYDEVSKQEKGDFTFIIGKKEDEGKAGGVRVIRGMGFYAGGRSPKEMRLNDFLPVESPEPGDLPQARIAVEELLLAIADGSFSTRVRSALHGDPVFTKMHSMFDTNHADPERPKLSRVDASLAALGWYVGRRTGAVPSALQETPTATVPTAPIATQSQTVSDADSKPTTASTSQTAVPATAVAVEPVSPATSADQLGLLNGALLSAINTVAAEVQANGAPPSPYSDYETAEPLDDDDDDEIVISAEALTTNVLLTNRDQQAFRDRALPLLRAHTWMASEDTSQDEAGFEASSESGNIADTREMLDVEVAARGKPFSSLDEKWAAERRIGETQASIARETSYIDPPTPEPIDVSVARTKLQTVAALCQNLYKSDIR